MNCISFRSCYYRTGSAKNGDPVSLALPSPPLAKFSFLGLLNVVLEIGAAVESTLRRHMLFGHLRKLPADAAASEVLLPNRFFGGAILSAVST